MQQERINKLDPQTIWDVLLQHGGAISGLFDFLNKNELTSIDIPEGEYFAPEVLNEDIVRILNPKGLIVPVIVSGFLPIIEDECYLCDENGNLIVDENGNEIIVSCEDYLVDNLGNYIVDENDNYISI